MIERVALAISPRVMSPLVSRTNNGRVHIADPPVLLAMDQAFKAKTTGLSDDMSAVLQKRKCM